MGLIYVKVKFGKETVSLSGKDKYFKDVVHTVNISTQPSYKMASKWSTAVRNKVQSWPDEDLKIIIHHLSFSPAHPNTFEFILS